MKHFKVFLTFFFMFLFVTSCNKDRFVKKPGTPLTFKSFNWSALEQKFFSKQPRALRSTHSRDGMGLELVYHPLLIKAYNKLAEQNESYSFVDGMVNKTGLPLWSESYVYQNPTSNENLVLIPLAFEFQNKLSGFISLTQKGPEIDNNFIINGISRQTLLDTTLGNPWEKLLYQKWMIAYDEKLFSTSEQVLKDAYCISKSRLNDVAPPVEGGPGDPPNRGPVGCKGDTLGGNCQWNTVEVCWHNGDQVHWFGGIKNMPPHLDHDHDGIINSEDPDFAQLGITQHDFEERVRIWWDEEYRDEYGEYDDNWGDPNDPDGGANIDFDALTQIWDSFGDFVRDLADDIGDVINDIDDWLDDLFHDDHCWGGQRPATGVENRTEVECEWFYLQDCGQGPGSDISWWDDFAAVVPCPECIGYQEYQDIFRDRLYAHWEEQYHGLGSAIDFWDFYNRNLEWNCDPYSPCFEECIDENFLNSLTKPEIISANNGILWSKTCKESFDYKRVGDGFTAQVNDITHAYQGSGFPPTILQYNIPELCIQVRGTDAFGNPLTKEKAAELSAYAMDNARLSLLPEIGLTVNDPETAKQRYKILLMQALVELTGGQATSSISFGHCLGNITPKDYLLKPLNIFTCSHW